ncbi:MAG: universal stress protein [Desulfobacterales bacterium]
MNLLVCYDYENPGGKLFDIAKSQARAFNAFVHVVSSHPGSSGEEIKKRKADQLWKEVEKIEKGLESAKAIFDEAGISCTTHISIRGLNPGEDLVLYARENKMDYIIIGIQKKSKMDKLIFGSTAQYILLHTHCPVVAVPTAS